MGAATDFFSIGYFSVAAVNYCLAAATDCFSISVIEIVGIDYRLFRL